VKPEMAPSSTAAPANTSCSRQPDEAVKHFRNAPRGLLGQAASPAQDAMLFNLALSTADLGRQPPTRD